MNDRKPTMRWEGAYTSGLAFLSHAYDLLVFNGKADQAAELCDRVFQCGSRENALKVVQDYIDISPEPVFADLPRRRKEKSHER